MISFGVFYRAAMACLIGETVVLPCGAVLPNRLAKSALTEGLSDARNRATEDHVRLYRAWSNGGTGLLVTGNIQVDRRYPERPGNVAIDGPQDEAQLAMLRKYAEAGKSGGSAIWVQLGHAGRQCDPLVNTSAVGPSATSWKHPIGVTMTPRMLTVEEVRDVCQRFVHAAKVCEEVGFDGVQLHCAHGYLLSSFLNPLANKRDDEYGGSLDNRARLILDTCRAVRAAVRPSFAVAVKINSADFQKGGFSPEECATVARWLDDAGIDLIELSGGNYENGAMVVGNSAVESFTGEKNRSTRVREAYFLEFVPQIRAQVKKAKVMVTGGMRSRTVMEDALKSGACDVIGIGRPLCGDTSCSKQLLDRSIDALPALESTLNLPFFLRPLNMTSFGPKITMGLQQMWYYWQERNIGTGRDVDASKSILSATIETLKIEHRQAAALEGLDCVGQALNAPPKTSPSPLSMLTKVVFVLVVAFAVNRARGRPQLKA